VLCTSEIIIMKFNIHFKCIFKCTYFREKQEREKSSKQASFRQLFETSSGLNKFKIPFQKTFREDVEQPVKVLNDLLRKYD
jgi:hypothetical protein